LFSADGNVGLVGFGVAAEARWLLINLGIGDSPETSQAEHLLQFTSKWGLFCGCGRDIA
jgi:hypothetical protein